MIFQLPTWGVGSWGSGLLSAYLLIKKWLSQLKSYCLIKKIKKIKMLLEQVVLKKKKLCFFVSTKYQIQGLELFRNYFLVWFFKPNDY